MTYAGPVLLVPGFMGSVLARSSGHARIWVDPLWAVPHVQEFLDNLELRTPADTRLSPDGVLHDVNIGDIIRVGIYRDLHEFCLSPAGLGLRPEDYYEFAFDWRKTLSEAAEQLATAVLSVPNPPITVIAHSQGGLVLTMLFHQHPAVGERIGKVFAVGCPFAGVVKTIAMIEQGTGILSALFPSDPIRTLLRTMPGTYEMFPSRATIPLFRDPDGKPARPCHDLSWFPSDKYDQTLLKQAGAVTSALPLELGVPLRIVEGYGVNTATLAQATTGKGPRVDWSIQGDGTCPARSLTAGTGTGGSGVADTTTLSIPFGEHVELIRRREFLKWLSDDLLGTPGKPQVTAVVRNHFQPAGTQNVIIVETRNDRGEPLGTARPTARLRQGIPIQLEPCPIAHEARWLGQFNQPTGADQILVAVPGSSVQPSPLIVAGT